MIKMENPLLKYLALQKVVEYGSFTGAAEAMDYAQSSVSKMIADLESEWGVLLVERSKRGVCLTSAGKEIMPFLQRVLEEQGELEKQILRINQVETGTVRIGTFSSVAINWLPNLFARLQKEHPGIEYEMLLGDYTEVEKWIVEGRVDCGFLRLPTLPGLDTVLLKQDEYKVILPPEHPLAAKKTVAIEALNGQPFLLLEHGGRTEVSDLLERDRVHPDIRFTTWEDFAILAMVERGMGISILPEMILHRIPYHVAVRPLERPYYRAIGLAMKNRQRLSPAAQTFLAYLRFRETEPSEAYYFLKTEESP